MESTRWKDLTLALFRSILEEPEFREAPAAGIAIQAYLRESQDDLRALLAWARERGRRIGVRLVKGAYWDYETILAAQEHWPPGVLRKAETDAQFERLAKKLIDNSAWTRPALGTHNIRASASASRPAEAAGLDLRAVEIQVLHGMADSIRRAAVHQGYRVREYVPVGELIPGMAYLVRRLLENTSNECFLLLRPCRRPGQSAPRGAEPGAWPAAHRRPTRRPSSPRRRRRRSRWGGRGGPTAALRRRQA